MKVLGLRMVSDENDVIITVQKGWWIFRHQVEYRGSSTVWNRYPGGGRAGTFMEGWLCAQWTSWRWDQKVTPMRRRQ